MIGFKPLEAPWGPGAQDPDLLRFVLRLSVQDGMEVVTRVRERSRFFITQGILEPESCDTRKRTEPILRI